MMRYFYSSFVVIIFTLLIFNFCKKEPKEVDVSSIKTEVKIIRFDQIFAGANDETFPKIKETYPFLFPDGRSYSDWLAYKNDTIFQELYKESQMVFGNFNKQEKELLDLFKHVKFYYPRFKEPKVFTLISNLDTENQIIFADSLLFISLDTYLGKDKIYYADSPEYVHKNFEPSRIIIDAASAIAYQTSPEITYRLFVERMVAAGKLKYAVQQFVPQKSEAEIMGYSEKQIEWAQTNEYFIWQYFMEKEYLYNPDRELQLRFLDIAPFSKFYIETDAESPGQIGIWMGLQIVKSFMEYNKVSYTDMMATPPIDIFNKSKYKPNK